MAGMRWLPLESNPDVINKYVKKIGLSDGVTFTDVYDLTEDGLNSIPKPLLALLLLFPKEYVKKLGMDVDKWQFTDIFGLEPDLLMMVPRPVAAVMLLYPLSEKTEADQFGRIEADNKQVYFIKQTIGNACGTIGLLHGLLNNREKLNITGDQHLAKFFDDTTDMDPTARAEYMEKDSVLGDAHETSAQEGQTQAPDREEKTNFHFICFIHKDGTLYELDGRKDGPVNHGPTAQDTFLEDACVVVKKFMGRDPDNLNFTMIALSKM